MDCDDNENIIDESGELFQEFGGLADEATDPMPAMKAWRPTGIVEGKNQLNTLSNK